MKLNFNTLLLVWVVLILSNCIPQKKEKFKPNVVYQSDDLIVTQISSNSFIHSSFLQTQDFGNVSCNGLIVTNNEEAIVFDTPTDDESSQELIKWIKEIRNCKINGIVPTHFHNDCLGGLRAFNESGIPSYAYFKTIELAKENNFVAPENSFMDSLHLNVGSKSVIIKFFGEGHTKDNIICYFPDENIMFGGCLIKELNAGKGYLGDANVADWPATVEKIKREYPSVKIVVPGHGEFGNADLLDYTINLFRK